MDFEKLMRRLRGAGVILHSALITENGNTLYEMYVPPFDADVNHRMYSQTKSFISMAVGCLIGEGKIKLTDRIVDYFPDKQPETVTREMAEQTVEDMLKMNTCSGGVDWFKPEVTDRLRCYFTQKPVRPAGTLFHYDSTGSYVLGCLVERVSGMGLLDYMRSRFLDEIGEFESAEILSCMDGTPWGDSALLATPRAMERFGRLLMQGGNWNGKQLIPEDYVKAAIVKQTDCSMSGLKGYDAHGYGYQVWRGPKGSYGLYGMGGQHTIIMPDKGIVFVCTGENQLNPFYGNRLFDCVMDFFYPDSEAEEAFSALPVARGEAHSDFEGEINGAWFACAENPMGIKKLRLVFDGNDSFMEYENAQGMKKLPFGMGENVFGLFPEYGYSDARGNEHIVSDFRYKDAVSAGWVEEKKLQILVQIIDRYLGTLVINIGFRDKDTCGIRMNKAAEDFLQTYNGWAGAYRM